VSTFRIAVITPEGTAYEGDALSVVAPGVAGSFGVLANHAPMIAAVGKGVLQVKEEAATALLVIGDGFLEVSKQGVLVLADRAVKAASPMEAERRLKQMQAAAPAAPLRLPTDTHAGTTAASAPVV
jgi:F-type H+-transporting ATPase subunit epsilon